MVLELLSVGAEGYEPGADHSQAVGERGGCRRAGAGLSRLARPFLASASSPGKWGEPPVGVGGNRLRKHLKISTRAVQLCSYFCVKA